MNIKTASLALALAALASCSQNVRPEPFNAVRPLTGDVYTERHNVKMVCGRAHGESYGFKLLGIIPITTASESEAVDRMYENARLRGVDLEGAPRHFVNTSYEKSNNYFVLASRPVIRVAADLVEIQGEPTEQMVQENAPVATEEAKDEGFGLGDIIAAPFKWYGNIMGAIFGA